MKTKQIILSSIVGAVVNFFLGFLLYGVVFASVFPQGEENTTTIYLYFVGSFIFSLFIAYIFVKWAGVHNCVEGLKAGAIIGFFMSIYYNVYHFIMFPETSMKMISIDVLCAIVMSALTGAIIGFLIGKLQKEVK